MQTSSTMRRLFGWLVLVSIWLAPVLAREWTDSTGKFRVQADLVAVRGENVILEREDGKILTIPIERLSVADREFLKSPPAPAPEAPTPASRPAAAAPAVAPRGDGPKLAQRTQQILRTACYRCHGEDGTSEGGFNFAINLGKLSRTLARPGDVAQSQLWARISARDDSVMPPVGESPRLSEEDLATVKAWIEAGSPALPSTESRPFITNEQVMDAILANVRAQPERSRRFMRYFTLTHLYNAGVSEDELQTYRNAFAKLLNSLSWNTDLVSPQPIDAARTVFGIDMRDVHWNGEIWQSIEEANPYYLQLTSPSALACYDETQSEMPYVRIDWFVFAASKPPLYHSVLNLPDSDSALEELLRINVAANIDQEQAIRAAFNRSGVSQHNRLIEWHKSPYGSYWKSYDFGGSTGRQNLFQYPLGPASDGDTFQHDGGEILFTLPNGLQGYLLVDGSGQRIDQGPTSIVSDPKRPDKTVTNGVSCMSCHYTGVIPKRDEVGGAVRANRGAFDEADDILAIYREPEELDRIFERDAQRFAGTLKKLGIASLSRSGEPVSAMAARFEQEVDLAYVACEFGLTAPDFEQRLNKAEVVARAFSPLKIPGGTIKRDVLKSMFADAAVDLKLTSSANASRIASLPRAATERAPRAAPPMSTGKSNAGKNNAGVEHASFSDLTWGVQSLAFSPDGRLLAAGKPDRALWMFDLQHRSKISEWNGLDSLQSVSACTFVPNGSQLLTAGRTGQILIHSVSSEGVLKEIGQFAGHSQEVTCLSVSSDGRYAVSGGQEKMARCWEIRTGRELGATPQFAGPIKAIHVLRGGRSALVTDGATLVEFDFTKAEARRQRPLARSWASGQSAAISPDGELVAIGDSYNIHVWNAETGQELPPLVGNEIAWSMAFTPDSTRLLSGGSSRVNVWEVRKARRIHAQSTAGGSTTIKALAISPDGKLYAAGGAPFDHLQVFTTPR